MKLLKLVLFIAMIMTIQTKVAFALEKDEFKESSALSKYLDNEEVALAEIMKDEYKMQHVTYELRNDPTFMLKAIKANSGVFQFASKSFRNNKDLVLEAIRLSKSGVPYETKNGVARNYYDYLKHVGSSLKKDKDVAFAAYKKNSLEFEYIDESLKNDKDFILKLISIEGEYFYIKNLSEELKNDRDIIVAANEDLFDTHYYFSYSDGYIGERLEPYSLYCLRRISSEQVDQIENVKDLLSGFFPKNDIDEMGVTYDLCKAMIDDQKITNNERIEIANKYYKDDVEYEVRTPSNSSK